MRCIVGFIFFSLYQSMLKYGVLGIKNLDPDIQGVQGGGKQTGRLHVICPIKRYFIYCILKQIGK
jgi:hypothetical protein